MEPDIVGQINKQSLSCDTLLFDLDSATALTCIDGIVGTMSVSTCQRVMSPPNPTGLLTLPS